MKKSFLFDVLNRKKILFAGVSSFVFIKDIAELFWSHGIAVTFIENKGMFSGVSSDDRNLVVCSECIPSGYDVIIPLNEGWVTKIIKSGGVDNISNLALVVTRNKSFFSDFLKNNGFDYCPYFSDVQAVKSYIDDGKCIVIKPNCLFSSQGVRVVNKDNISNLMRYISEATNIDPIVKQVLGVPTADIVFWEHFVGREYGVDFFVDGSEFHCIRFSEKIIRNVDGRPINIAYRMIEPLQDVVYICEAILEKVYKGSDISFANFDVIRTIDGRIVPIDFACRLAGGIQNLLKYSQENLYMNSFVNSRKRYAKGWCQYNLVSSVSGVIRNDKYFFDGGFTKKLKHFGDRITSDVTRISNRIAENYIFISDEVNFYKKAYELMDGNIYVEPQTSR